MGFAWLYPSYGLRSIRATIGYELQGRADALTAHCNSSLYGLTPRNRYVSVLNGTPE
jgi:hypothetical protein